jgi:hypothetical protein
MGKIGVHLTLGLTRLERTEEEAATLILCYDTETPLMKITKNRSQDSYHLNRGSSQVSQGMFALHQSNWLMEQKQACLFVFSNT